MVCTALSQAGGKAQAERPGPGKGARPKKGCAKDRPLIILQEHWQEPRDNGRFRPGQAGGGEHDGIIPRGTRTGICRHSGSPPSARHTLSARRTTAKGRSPGLRVIAGSRRLLGIGRSQWPLARGYPLTVAGAAGVSHPVPVLIPVPGEPVAARALSEAACSVNHKQP